MSAEYCKYHPLQSASQYCEHCQVSYCQDCSDESGLRDRRNQGYRCFVCESAMRPLELAFKVEPFWRRLAAVYRYPLNLSGTTLILLTALLSAALAGAFIFVLIPAILITVYCFACLNKTASGEMQAPDFSKCFEESVAVLFYVYICLVVVGWVVGFAFSAFGPGVGMLMMVFSVIVLPAAVMIIAIDESLLSALNPAKLVGIITATGTSYFVMLLFVIIMISSLAAVTAVFGSFQDSFFSRFLHSAISNYYSIVVFHIMGYLVYQNRYQLGFETRNSGNGDKQRSAAKLLESKIAVLVKAGRYQSALELCMRQIGPNRNATMWHWERCFNLMFASSRKRNISEFANRYLNQLLGHDHSEQMANAWLKVRTRVADFLPARHSVRLEIANELNGLGRHEFAAVILDRFHEDCKDTRQIASACNLLSEAYAGIPGQQAKAASWRKQAQLLAGEVPPEATQSSRSRTTDRPAN